MTNTKSTKRALLVSVMAMVICFTMLLGTTFAWFTDFEESTGNIIKSGTLEIQFEHYNFTNSVYESAETGAIFDYQNWEPGYVDLEQIKITNAGSLDFNYKLKIVGTYTALADVIEVYCFEGVKADVERNELVAVKDPSTPGLGYLGTLAEVADISFDFASNSLLDGASQEYTIVLKMSETAGNQYQNSTFSNFSVQVLATQMTSEVDTWNDQYDATPEGAFPGQNSVPAHP